MWQQSDLPKVIQQVSGRTKYYMQIPGLPPHLSPAHKPPTLAFIK